MKKIYQTLFIVTVFLAQTLVLKATVTPTFYNSNTTTAKDEAPFNDYLNNKCQWVFGPNIFHTNGATGNAVQATGTSIKAIYLRRLVANDANYSTYPILTISMSQNVGTATTFTSTNFTTGMTQVFNQTNFSFSDSIPGWYKFTLATPIAYDPTKSLVLEIKNNLTFSIINSVGNALATTINAGQNQKMSNIYSSSVGSYTTGIIDFGFDTTYVATCTPTSSSITKTSCGAYTLNGTSYTASGTYTQHLTNAAGCDSAITLNLTIPVLNLTTTVAGNTITSNTPSATYKWINCATYTAIAGATAQSYTPSVSGSYAVIVTNGPCFDTSACVSVVVSSTNDLLNENNFKIYPNPSSGKYTMSYTNDAKIEITNILGEIIYTSAFLKGIQTIDLQNQTNGVYFLKVMSQGKQQTVKITKAN